MKKVVRTVWISLLTGLAFLVACTTPKGLTRAEKKQLKAERAELVAQIEEESVQFFFVHCVEIARRLIGKNNFGAVNQRASNGNGSTVYVFHFSVFAAVRVHELIVTSSPFTLPPP